ncbi:hypothetical protein BKA93DRAFT_753500 [Sparassis latifolia]
MTKFLLDVRDFRVATHVFPWSQGIAQNHSEFHLQGDLQRAEVEEVSTDGLQQDEVFFFADGNIVLIAGRAAFRMLYNDGACEERLDFTEVVAVVCLSHKYEIDTLLCDEVAWIKTVLTSNLAEWEKLVWGEMNAANSITVHHISSQTLRIKETEVIAAVNLVHRIGISSMMPAALYLCCIFGPLTLLQGYYPHSSGVLERLSITDLEKCMRGAPVFSFVAVSEDGNSYGTCSQQFLTWEHGRISTSLHSPTTHFLLLSSYVAVLPYRLAAWQHIPSLEIKSIPDCCKRLKPRGTY